MLIFLDGMFHFTSHEQIRILLKNSHRRVEVAIYASEAYKQEVANRSR